MLEKVLKQFLIVSLILLGTLFWSLTIVKSGWLYDYGLGFWGANGHDGIWHIAVANNLAKFSFENPVFANSNLQNYHIGFALFLALINRLTTISIHNLYFQVLPPIFALLIGVLTYKFVSEWTKSKKSGLLSTFFVYFGGSMAWIFGCGESAFWSQQAISTLINPPFAMSLIFILFGLLALQKKKTFLAILCFGLLIQIKVYAGLLILGGLFISGVYSYFFLPTKSAKLRLKTNYFLKIFIWTLLLSVLIFLPFNRSPQGLIQWQPFWFLETMMSYSDRLGWQRFYSAMTTYKMGNIWHKEMFAYLIAFLIFIVGNFWTRLVFLKDILKNIDSIKILFLAIITAGVLVPTFFLQTGTPWNTIQFLYYSLFFSGILVGIAATKLNRWVLIILILITLPTTLITLKYVYIPSRPPAMLPNSEIEALSFLRSQPAGIVLTYPFDADKAKEAISNPPRPLYLYESTAYVSAFGQKQVFLEDEVNLNITGYDWKTRRDDILAWYKESNSIKARQFLDNNNITYIYWVKPQRAFLGETQLGLEKIFENKGVIVFRANQK